MEENGQTDFFGILDYAEPLWDYDSLLQTVLIGFIFTSLLLSLFLLPSLFLPPYIFLPHSLSLSPYLFLPLSPIFHTLTQKLQIIFFLFKSPNPVSPSKMQMQMLHFDFFNFFSCSVFPEIIHLNSLQVFFFFRNDSFKFFNEPSAPLNKI